MNLDDKEVEKVKEFFRELNNKDLNYLVLRKYEELPYKAKDGDIDILTNNTEELVRIGSSLGFSRDRNSFTKNLLEIIKKSLNRPFSIAKTFYTNPKGSIRRIFNKDITTPRLRGVEEGKIYYNDLVIHITDHVHYKSTEDSRRILASSKINESLIENRKSKQLGSLTVKTPSVSDELCQLVARGVFDYNGDFPDYYKNKIYELYSSISEEEKDRFRELLEEIFFQASPLVLDSIEDQNLDSLRQNLREFSDY